MRVAIIGYGEVGSIFARDLTTGGVEAISAFDIAEARQQAAAQAVEAAVDAATAAAGADIIFVCVTAAAVLDAVTSLGGGLGAHPLVVDVNSVSPATKQRAGEIVERAGGRYVEAAVMSSIPPRGLRSPMLIGGPHAHAFVAAMAPFGMDLTVFSETVGQASSVKMCRSVMIKGLEALWTECLLAARHYGVEEQVLASLSDTLPKAEWSEIARYMIGRSLLHGRRRAEEMREVATTVSDAGLQPLLSEAIAQRQQWAGDVGRSHELSSGTLSQTKLGPLLDQLRR